MTFLRLPCPRSTRRSASPSASWPTTRSPRAPRRSTSPPSSPRTCATRWSMRTCMPCTSRRSTAARVPTRSRPDRDRGGRAGLRLVLADPGREQAGHPAAHPVRPRRRSSRRCLPRSPRGEAMFSYALSEPEAGSDAAAMRTRAVRDGDRYVLNGTKRWITNAGVSKYYTVMAVTDPGRGPERHLGVRGGEGRRGLLVRRAGAQARHQGLARPASSTSTTAGSRPTG